MAEGDIGRTEPGSENLPLYSSLYSRHSRNYVESVSVETCTIMTRLGYGEEIRRWRVEKYREVDRLDNVSNVTRITAGSKAEGLTGICESDWDILYVPDNILCVEAGINLHTISDDIDVFRMDTRVYPGHCRLLQERAAQCHYEELYNALCDDGYGDVLLSSSILLDELGLGLLHTDNVVQHERTGPSIPFVIAGLMHFDSVISLRCHCPSILQTWAARPRHWPSTAIVQKVVSLGAYVTPVGYKGSEFNHMEWRICFSTGEAELVNNLNGTQVKVYVMLKMILKDILKPQNKEITSYVLKNIILWQAERNPQSQFDEHNLFYWLHDGLRELRTAIARKHVAYYMIPYRNLMAACGLGEALQHKWLADITEMMAEGPRVIMRLPRIRQAVVASPEPMLWFSKKRIELEMLFLEDFAKDMRNDVIDQEIRRVLRRVRQRMILEGSVVNNLDDLAIEILTQY